MKGRTKVFVILSILFLCILSDQITKIIAVATLTSSPPITYLGDFFRFQYAENTGAMLGFGSGLPDGVRFWLLTVLVGILLIALLIFLFMSQKLTNPQIIALSLICGGGLSNFIDRVLNDGRVVDFMNMGIGWLRTGIFNLADVQIMIGLGMILLFGEWTKKKETVEPDD
jgi:signal peptidase II